MAITIQRPKVDAQTAERIAENYLMDHVGDLLGAGSASLSADGRWIIPVILSNVRQGDIGEVGTIAVDAESGRVLFTEEDRQRVKASARKLAAAHPL